MITAREPAEEKSSNELSPCQQKSLTIFKAAVGTVGIFSALPNTQYAMVFTGGTPLASPTDVSLEWFLNLPPEKRIGAAYFGGSTAVISASFGCFFLILSTVRMYEEYQLLKQGKNKARFPLEVVLALLSALTGGIIAGGPYKNPVMQRLFQLDGFLTVGGLSFLGMSDLLINMFDEDRKAKRAVLTQLHRINPVYRDEVNDLLHGKTLTAQTAQNFLHQVFQLGYQRQLAHDRDPSVDLMFLDRSQKDKAFAVIDGILSLVLSFSYFMICVQGGFNGINLFDSNKESNAPDAEKFGIGFAPGLPLGLFAFFTMRFFRNPLMEFLPEIQQARMGWLQLAGLLFLCIGNAGWYGTLGRVTIDSSSVFSFLKGTFLGEYVYPWFPFGVCVDMSFWGLFSKLFPPRVNKEAPRLVDVSKSLEHDIIKIPAHTYHELRNFSIFKRMAEVPAVVIHLSKEVEASHIFSAEKKPGYLNVNPVLKF